MNDILIYNILEHRDFHFFIDFFKIASGLLFIFIPAYFSMKDRYSKKKFIKIYLYLIPLFMLVNLLISIDINRTIANKNFLKIEGEIYNYKKTSNNYESFYVDGHKFQSANRYGFKYKYKDNKVILKNGYKVKIHYDSEGILQFWIEYKATNKLPRYTDH